MAASQPCVSCRAPLPLGARFCNECGTSQPLAAAPVPVAPAPPPPSAPQKIGLKTVVGVAAPSAAEMAEAARSMGIRPQPQAPAPPAQPQPLPPSYPAPAVAPAAVSPPAGVTRKPLNATMIGVATPGVPAEMTRAAKSNVPKGTLVGVALPGIAPTHPQTAPAPAYAPPPAYPPPSAPAPAFAPPPNYGGPGYPPAQPAPQPEFAPPPAFDPAVLDEVAPAPKRSGRGLAIALILLALLGTGVAVFFLFLRPSGPPALSGTVRTKDGAQSLVVQCDTCEDGATIDLGKDKSGEFSGKKATLPLGEDALKAGKNAFSGEIVVKKGSKPQKISLEVVVPFLVKASLAPLGEGEPAVELQFDLAPDVKKVTVEGKKVEGDKVRVALDPVTTDAKTLAKKIAYAVDGTEGTVEVSIPVAPLRLALPGRRALVTGEAFVSGRTAPGAFVTIGTTKLTADKEGVFKGKVTVTEATLTVVAFGGKFAPRAATVSGIVVAKDLAEAQKALKAEAKTKLDDVVKAPDASAGKLVSGHVKILTTVEEDGRGVAVAETMCAKAGDEAPCPVVRLLLPAGAQLQKNDLVDVVGVVVRAVPIDKGKSTATELDVSIVEKP